jgi:Holliday junction DNA helicase RuvA
MYEFLEGKVVRWAPTSLVLAVGGLGYFLNVPLGTRFEVGGRARVWTHFVVREEAHTLYGFKDTEQRDLFRLLLTVRGVGPAVALALLSGLDVARLVRAILTEDKAALTRIKGVGKKTAEQILLDLRERVARLGGELAFTDVTSAEPAHEHEERVGDAVAALVSIGYKEREARKLVERAATTSAEAGVEDLIRAVLQG